HGLPPCATEMEDLGAAQEALSAVGDQVRLAGAPAGEGGGPFLGPTPIEDLLATREHTAVHVPGDDRGHLSRGYRDHGLVEERDTLVQSAQPDQGTTLPMARHRHEVRLIEATADRRGLAK